MIRNVIKKISEDVAEELYDKIYFNSDDIVVSLLTDYYEESSKPDKIDNSNDYIEPDEDLLLAIDRVLQDFMPPDKYTEWKRDTLNDNNQPN